ncbi:transketolase [Peptostreptococcus russellii]|uniref:Transketolase n=1 Tax=Peptostreptococcus russellii TaxID=215200 RepID=A0A2P7PYP4_9FIRM|nr:transketolase family protein [Peptostreptococcus russellii]PSJ30832.1 transketolase [Peptostreptococcus russellii]
MSKKSMREAFGNTLVELGEEDQDIVVVDADLSTSTKTDIFKKVFSERFIDVGIAEQNLIGVSSGIASTGKKVFASSFAVFETGRAYEVIRNMTCMANLNVKLCATHAGLMTGPDGATHQSIEDLAIMRVLPNMKVFVPADAYETRQIVRAAAEVEGPVYIRMVRDDVENIYTDEYEFEMGKASLLREGNDLSIVACGPMVRLAIEASDRLRDEGINARVVNMSTIKPIDTDILLDCAQNTRGIITVEDHSVLGGLGSAVSEVVSETIPTKVCKIGVKDLFGMSGKTEELYEQYGLTEDSIYEKAMQMMEIEPAK